MELNPSVVIDIGACILSQSEHLIVMKEFPMSDILSQINFQQRDLIPPVNQTSVAH